jgi:hypothetical protein
VKLEVSLTDVAKHNAGDVERSGRVTWLSATPDHHGPTESDGRHFLPPSCLRGIDALASWHGCFLEPQHCRFRSAHVPTNAEGLMALFHPGVFRSDGMLHTRSKYCN